MRDQRKSHAAAYAGVVLAVLLGLYVGAYYGTVRVVRLYRFETLEGVGYTLGPYPFGWIPPAGFFTPVQKFDRWLRPRVWGP